MDIRYVLYAISDKKYYVPNRKGRGKGMIKIPELPAGWNEIVTSQNN